VRIDETAICSALQADVTARKRRMRMATAPLWPARAAAALTAGKPAETSDGVKVIRGFDP